MLDASLERMRAENQVVHQQQTANFALPIIYIFLFCIVLLIQKQVIHCIICVSRLAPGIGDKRDIGGTLVD